MRQIWKPMCILTSALSVEKGFVMNVLTREPGRAAFVWPAYHKNKEKIMPFLLQKTIANFLKLRDELTLRNIRRELLPLILIFPLSVIVGDLRYFDLRIEMWSFQSFELMLYPLGLGWLVLAFIPKRMIIPLLKIAAICSALLLPFQFSLSSNASLLVVFMAFQFVNGICAASAFYLFCFRLNNVERLLGMSVIIFYYGFWYTIWRAFPLVQEIGKTWGGAIVVALYVLVVFLFPKSNNMDSADANSADADNASTHGTGTHDTGMNGTAVSSPAGTNALAPNTRSEVYSGAKIVIGLHMVYYTIMCTINYIEWMESSVSSMPFGLGQFAAVIFILIVQVRVSQSALYIWLMYLVLSLFGLGILIYDSHSARFIGSLVYGLGDGLGYIIIYYLCAGVINKSQSYKLYKLTCLVLFVEYCLISGLYSRAMNFYEGPKHYLAFGVVLVLCSICFLLIPYLQKKLYQNDWTDGIQLQKTPEYAELLAETETVNSRDDLNLTEREQEIFTLLLKGVSPKEIGYTLKVSYHTVGFHRKNMYRKLGIQSIHELLAKYGSEIS